MLDAFVETKRVFENKEFTDAISDEILLPIPSPTIEQEKKDIERLQAISKKPLCFTLQTAGDIWSFKIFWQTDNSEVHWMSVEYPSDSEIHVYLNAGHPFFEPYIENPRMIELIQKFVLSLALAEKLSRIHSVDNKVDAADFRNYMNRVLRYASQIREDMDDSGDNKP